MRSRESSEQQSTGSVGPDNQQPRRVSRHYLEMLGLCDLVTGQLGRAVPLLVTGGRHLLVLLLTLVFGTLSALLLLLRPGQ